MERNKKRNYDHRDESEVFKQKSFKATRNRKMWSKITFIVMCSIAIIIIAACLICYFFNFS